MTAPRRLAHKTQAGAVHGAMALGTVQLGMPYGAANRTGQPSLAEAAEIVRTAVDAGVTALDTARGYGTSEACLGEILRDGLAARVAVVTKLAHLAGLDDATPERELRAAVDASVFRSCRELRSSTLHTLLLHLYKHHRMAGGAVWRRLVELKAEGVIGRLGASVDNVADAVQALDDPDVGHLQLPFNVLDQRWFDDGLQARLRARPDVIVHTRSALLQGILVADASAWPRNGGDAAGFLRRLDDLVARFGRVDRADLCLAYVRAQPWVTSVLVGVESLAQLRANLDHFATPPLSEAQCQEARATLTGASEELLNPARWQRR